jgi:hypothetical protein
MSMKDLEEALQLIREHEDQAFFAGPRDERFIEAAERALGLSFPPTYRRFLRELGCGDIAGEEFYGLVDDDFVDSGIPDGIWLTLKVRQEDSEFPRHLIIVAATGDGGYYAIDTSRRSSEGESPVVMWFPGPPGGHVEEVAEDFGAFMLQQIKQALEWQSED